MKARITCFISLIKLLFSVKEKDDTQSAYVYFNFFHETVPSHNSSQFFFKAEKPLS